MTNSSDHVLVTGASGSLGGSMAIWLAQRGLHVHALARSPSKANFLRTSGTVQIFQGDLLDPPSLVRAMEGCRLVFHCAAALSGSLSVQRPVNVDGTRNVAQAAAQVEVERLVHISTLSVYSMRKGCYSEEMPLSPGDDPYSSTKAEAESVLREEAQQSGLHYTIVRPGAIYGPRGHWTRSIFSLARRSPVIFIGPGTGVLPLIYIDDLLEECWLCATHPAAVGEAFNSVYSPQPEIKRVLLAFASLIGRPRYIGLPAAPLTGIARLLAAMAPPHTNLKTIPNFLAMLSDPVTYSMEKSKQVLGWLPAVDVEDGVRLSAAWMKEAGLL